jgi:hypothetical protein
MTTIILQLWVRLVFLLTIGCMPAELCCDQRLNLVQLISNSRAAEGDGISLSLT